MQEWIRVDLGPILIVTLGLASVNEIANKVVIKVVSLARIQLLPCRLCYVVFEREEATLSLDHRCVQQALIDC